MYLNKHDGLKFLYPLKEAGFRNVSGCDPFIPENLKYNNGLPVYKKHFSQMNGKYDIITFNHSFEHIEDPLEILKHANKLLAVNGTCIVRIPTTSSFAWKYYNVNCFQLDAPRHIFLHSKKSINILAKNAGLKVIQVVFDSTHHQLHFVNVIKKGKNWANGYIPIFLNVY